MVRKATKGGDNSRASELRKLSLADKSVIRRKQSDFANSLAKGSSKGASKFGLGGKKNKGKKEIIETNSGGVFDL